VRNTGVAFAAAPASDNAGNSAYSSTFWNNNSNGGSGFGPWILAPGGKPRFFVGTSTGNGYVYNIGDGNNLDIGVAFTDGGLTISLTLAAGNAFTLSVTPNGGPTSVRAGTISPSDISQFQLFNNNAGPGASHDLFFNNVSVSAVAEPSSLTLISAAFIIAALYVCRRSNKPQTTGCIEYIDERYPLS
jgi:hypothetical protein